MSFSSFYADRTIVLQQLPCNNRPCCSKVHNVYESFFPVMNFFAAGQIMVASPLALLSFLKRDNWGRVRQSDEQVCSFEWLIFSV